MTKPFQFHFGQACYVLKFKSGFGLFCLLIIILCCCLGDWQLHRYHYKQNLLLTYQQNLNSAPVPLAQAVGDESNMQFKSVVVKGNYRNDLTLVLSNRWYQDKMGFEVFTPFQVAGEKKLLLVDRGWIPAENKQTTPAIQPATKVNKITGKIKLLNEYQFILGKNILAANTAPMLLQKIDIKELNQLTQQTFYPFILRLSPQDKNGFVRDWTIATVMPKRHLGYAVQWFALAFALVIAYGCFCCERVKK